MNEVDESNESDLGPSRSEQRRAALDVLRMAGELVALSDAQLERVPLDDDLRELVVQSRAITQQIARKRQLQFLAKHLREHPLEEIRAALDEDRSVGRRDTAVLHRCEHLRDRLIEDGDRALQALLEEHPEADAQHLRALLRQARKERDANRPPAAARALFRALRELLMRPGRSAEST